MTAAQVNKILFNKLIIHDNKSDMAIDSKTQFNLKVFYRRKVEIYYKKLSNPQTQELRNMYTSIYISQNSKGRTKIPSGH